MVDLLSFQLIIWSGCHTNIYDERQIPIDDAKIAKQFEETATEKQVPRKETVIKLPVDEIVHVGTKKEAMHLGTVYRANPNETAGTIKVVQEEQAGEQIPGSSIALMGLIRLNIRLR